MSALNCIVITNDTARAALAVKAGVQRIMVDLEYIGKSDRQPAGSLISAHSFDDISAVRAVISGASLIVRINPAGETTRTEIEEAISRGADFIMLPMVTGPDQMALVKAIIAGRAKLIPLIEHIDALNNAEAILNAGADEAYLGLNDLHLSLGQHFMFEPLADGLVDGFAKACAIRGIAFGFGGVGKMGAGQLPADAIIAEHARLGSTRVIISRAFDRALEAAGTTSDDAYIQGVNEIFAAYEAARMRTPAEHETAAKATYQSIRQIAANLQAKAS